MKKLSLLTTALALVLAVGQANAFTSPELYIDNSLFERNVYDGNGGYDDLTIGFNGGIQRWSLLIEDAGWRNENAFGYYTDLDGKSDPKKIFRGPDSPPLTATTSIAAGQEVGLWLSPRGRSPFVYSQADGQAYQPFYIYDVSMFQSETFEFRRDGQTHTVSGTYDYLIYIDDGGAGPDYDYNDMIVGVSAVPEPATLLLMGLGLAGAGLYRKRTR